jgi:hypothetical protein
MIANTKPDYIQILVEFFLPREMGALELDITYSAMA